MAVQHPAAALHAVATKLDALDELLADPWTAWNRMDPFARSMLHNDNVRQWCDEVRKERERLRDERTALVKMHALVMESEMRSTTAQLHPGTRARTSAQVSDEPSASDSTAVDESNVNFGEEIGSAELYESSAMMCARRKPYVKGELILVVVKRAARQQGFHATMYSVGEKSVPPFCAISHAWLESSITDPEDFDNEGMMWKVQHDPRAAEQLAATLLSLTANNRAATLWIDFLCLPQALEFSRHPEIFSSMSRVYSQCVKLWTRMSRRSSSISTTRCTLRMRRKTCLIRSTPVSSKRS
ncbi:hypothetical protein BJ742DRAFT_307586 [Cladochytrium replicatum]|nr:hypothetical protein BJ742DRAFT_307586 [Cladochytrium replicatum]